MSEGTPNRWNVRPYRERDRRSGERERPAGPRAWELVLAVAIVVSCVGAQTFLASTRGLISFVDQASVGRFPDSDSAAGEGPIRLPGGREGGAIEVLGTLELDRNSTYLMTADLSAGDRLTFVLRNRESSGQVFCPPRSWSQSCLNLIDPRELPENPELRAVYHGRSDLEIGRVEIGKLSPWHPTLHWLLVAAACLVSAIFVTRHSRRWLAEGFRPHKVDDAAFALMLFGLCMLVFHSAPVRQVLDSRFLTAVSHSVIHGDGVSLPDYFQPGDANRRYQIDRIGGRLLHHYSPVPAILDAPVVAAYELFGVTPASKIGVGWNRGVEMRIMKFSSAFSAALLCVVLYLLARLQLGPFVSLSLALAFAFGTQIFSTLSRPYWAHTWGAVLAATALWLVIRPVRDRQGIWSAALAATLVSAAFFCRPQVVWTVVGLVAILAISRSWKRLGTLVAVGALWAVAGALASLEIYDSVLPSYFFAAQVERGRFAAGSVDSYRYVTGTLGALVSPGRGLFVYVPILLWVVFQTLRGWRSLASKAWAGVALAVIAAHLWMLVHTGVWPGGRSFGARQFSDVLIWFFLLAVLAVGSLQLRWHDLLPGKRRAQIAALLVTLVFSVFVNFRGAWSRDTWDWRSYDRPPRWLTEGREPLLPQPEYWNWRYPQFLAGLLPPDAAPAEESGGKAE